MNSYVLGLFIVVISFLLQVWPRYKNRYFGVDTWRHLMYADYVRKNKELPESISDKYLVSGPYGYPPIIILLLAKFPKKFVDEYQFIFSPFFDAIHNYIIFLSALYITSDLVTALVAQIIVSTIPLIAMEASNLSTRSLSYLIFTLASFPLLLFIHSGLLFWLFIAATGLILLFFTHRFALQAYIFLIVALTILQRNPAYLLFFTIIAAIVFFKGGKVYKAVFKEHVGMLTYWRNNINLRFAHQFRGVPRKKTHDFIVNIYMSSVKNPFVTILGSNPWVGYYLGLLLLVSLHIVKVRTIINAEYFTEFQIWIFSLIICAILILVIKPLRFLGEGHRYIEYITFPLSIVMGFVISELIKSYGIIVIIFFAVASLINIAEIIFLQYKTVIRDRGRTISKELWQIIKLLNKQKNVRLAIFPLSIGDAMMYFIKGRVLTSDNVFGLLQINDIYPMVTKPMTTIIRKYRLSHILIDKKYITLEELNVKKYTVKFDKNDYMLLEV